MEVDFFTTKVSDIGAWLVAIPVASVTNLPSPNQVLVQHPSRWVPQSIKEQIVDSVDELVTWGSMDFLVPEMQAASIDFKQ